MRNFSISRLSTSRGIIKISGVVHFETKKHWLDVNSMSIMGTDGWVELSLEKPQTTELLELINKELMDHIAK